jgi:hypothetical protein
MGDRSPCFLSGIVCSWIKVRNPTKSSLIRTEGENGKQLLRHFSNYEYEKAADIALRILKKRTPQPFEQPEDWV